MVKQKNETVEMSEDSMVKSFTESQDKNEFLDILKNLFDKSSIELITDISKDEAKLITRIRTIAELKDIPIYENALGCYMELCLSVGRKSRREIIEAVKGYSMLNVRKGLFGGGGFGGQKY